MNRIKLLLVMGVVVLGPVLLGVVDYLSHGETTCIYDAVGLGCMGCNGSGAFYELRRGRILESFRANPFILLWVGLGTILIANELYIYLRRYFDREYTKESLVDSLIKKMFEGIDFKEE
ncbi:MAG: DUF2752 domain-containing protein [Cellulosilyticaceae bacterium]